jgi:hypothetical protein
MTVAVRGRVPKKWNDNTVRHITERLQALERALGGGRDEFVTPAAPLFGGGTPPPEPPPSPPGGGGGTTDHGELTGRDDHDHDQYVLHEEEARAFPHVHGEHDIPNLEARFPERGESVRPEPHVHAATDVVGIEGDHPRRGELTPPSPHQHALGDVADFNQWEMTLWRRILNGPYGG